MLEHFTVYTIIHQRSSPQTTVKIQAGADSSLLTSDGKTVADVAMKLTTKDPRICQEIRFLSTGKVDALKLNISAPILCAEPYRL